MHDSRWEFVADVPAPGSDDRKHQPPALGEQDLVDVRIARADLLQHVANIKLDGSTAARFEVDEQQSVKQTMVRRALCC